MSKERLRDKEVYNYTEALNQPIWIQKLTENFSLPYAVKLSYIVWFLIFLGGGIWLALRLADWTPFPFPFWITFGVFGAGWLAIVVADLKIDGKGFVRFFWDYYRFYRKFGRRAKTSYLNDGYIYKKQKELLEREVKRVKKL